MPETTLFQEDQKGLTEKTNVHREQSEQLKVVEHKPSKSFFWLIFFLFEEMELNRAVKPVKLHSTWEAKNTIVQATELIINQRP